MKCRDCKNAIIDKTKGDAEMAAYGYRTCKLSRTEVEKATYFRGDTECMFPERLK